MNIQNDKALDIALGNSRKTKTWKNKPMHWSELLDRLATVTRTPETVAEYKAMSRTRQSEIKDVGGFVGGYCNHGNRSDVRHRSLLCLDADFADADLWPDWKNQYGKAAAVYSTHKHTPDKPRLRLVVPLSRDVSPDEYQAIGRRVAAELGIDKFDDTSFQPQRLMYWPSCSYDGEYIFDYVDADFLNPDEVLATYHNWADVSSWPMSSRQAEIIKRSGAKQGDPLEKNGLVGAFCRAYYPIQDAIAEFIPEYQPCGVPNRYTYTEGTTAAGVVVYDDKFTYSHHSTDPASGQTCNAWDLVRLHKFHELDADHDPDKPGTSRPSFKAMVDLAQNDPRVKLQLVDDLQAKADDFEALPDDAAPDDWKKRLEVSDKGGLAVTIDNVAVILEHDPKLAGALAVNDLTHNIEVKRGLPWRDVGTSSPWTDSDDAALRHYLERVYKISGKEKIFDAVNIMAEKNRFHPVRDYLDGCAWDGVPRVETVLIDYLGAEDNVYTRAVTRKTLAAAVARAYNPGCKFDYMLTIRGRQGIGKSAILAKMGGEWFSDTFGTMQGKEAYEQAIGVWIVEVGELAGMRKAEAETIKQYITKQKDRFRPAYGRRSQEFPRQCIFIGTTNEQTFLRDATGNRRFWVVDTPNEPKLDLWSDLTPETVRLIWAEAVEIYRKGESLHLPREIEKMARDIQETYEEENPRVGIIADYLDRKLPDGWDDLDTYTRRQWLETDAVGTNPRTAVCTLEIWAEALNGNPERMDWYAAKEIRDILAKFPEWRHQGNRKLTIKPYGRQRYYIRKDDTDAD